MRHRRRAGVNELLQNHAPPLCGILLSYLVLGPEPSSLSQKGTQEAAAITYGKFCLFYEIFTLQPSVYLSVTSRMAPDRVRWR